jgi:hypothetical protein
MKDQDWDEVRRQVRRRAAAKMALIVAPIGILVVAFKMLEAHDYPVGDIRNEPMFWIAFGGAMIAILSVLIVGSILTLTKR